MQKIKEKTRKACKGLDAAKELSWMRSEPVQEQLLQAANWAPEFQEQPKK